jgi:hypothetical protein
MPKVVGTHLRRKRLDELADEFEQGLDRAGGAFAQRSFQPGEGLLDWIEVGRVGRQIRTRAPTASIVSRTPAIL